MLTDDDFYELSEWKRWLRQSAEVASTIVDPYVDTLRPFLEASEALAVACALLSESSDHNLLTALLEIRTGVTSSADAIEAIGTILHIRHLPGPAPSDWDKVALVVLAQRAAASGSPEDVAGFTAIVTRAWMTGMEVKDLVSLVDLASSFDEESRQDAAFAAARSLLERSVGSLRDQTREDLARSPRASWLEAVV